MRFLFFLLLIASGLCGCFHQGYYVSPFNGMTASYRTMPLHGDSVKKASYFNAALFTGAGNDAGRDKKTAIGLDFSRSHNFGQFQAHYGAGITAGSYHLTLYDGFRGGPAGTYMSVNDRNGHYFFGGAGVDAGINFVVPGHNLEWRMLGVETSLRHEFGNYLKLRKSLPDTLTALIIRDRFFGTIGYSTELLGHVSKSGIMGVKMSYGSTIGANYRDPNGYRNNHYVTGMVFHYFNIAAHYTQDRYTFYLQSCVAAKTNHFSCGLNLRLGKNTYHAKQ